MSLLKLLFLIPFLFPLCNVFAQTDSVLQTLKTLPDKYLKDTEKKIDNILIEFPLKQKRPLPN